MNGNVRKNILRKLLLRTGKSGSRLVVSLISLCIGTTLLLLSVMIWWNFQELLHGGSSNDSLGSTFITISKQVTEENMGQARLTVFSPLEIESVRNAPEVEDVGVMTSNKFPVYMVLNSNVGFATDMFLNAVPDQFIDKKPPDWYWQLGTPQVPLIISSQFLDLYNYGLALSQGLPQLSEASIKSLAFDLKVGAGVNQKVFTAHVVGFSDRINSVLVPQSFLDFGNRVYGSNAQSNPSQLILKVKDPSDKQFSNFLKERSYNANSEELRWNKIRSVVEVVSGATGILALLLMGIGTLVFVLFVELTIARAQHALALLLQIGYSPKFVSRFMIKRFLPLILITVLIAMGIAVGAQVFFSNYILAMDLTLPAVPGWPVWAALCLSTAILLLLVSTSINRAIRKN